MNIDPGRFDRLLEMFKAGEKLPYHGSDWENEEKLRKLLMASSPRLTELPDKLVIKILDRAVDERADFVLIEEPVVERGVFTGQVRFMKRIRYRNLIPQLLGWLNLVLNYKQVGHAEYSERFSDYQ